MKYTLRNATLLDGTQTMKPKPNMTIWIDGEGISKIAENGPDMPNSEVIDLEGQYLMPGLINLNVYLGANGEGIKNNSKPTDYKKLAQTWLKSKIAQGVFQMMMESHAKQELYSGVTTIRTIGNIADFDSKLRDRINNNEAEGPRIITSNTSISAPGGLFAGSFATESVSNSTIKEDINNVAATGPDYMHLNITNSFIYAEEDRANETMMMSPDQLRTACEEAHRLGYVVSAHVEGRSGVISAIENGVDIVEHGSKLDDQMVDEFAQYGMVYITSISSAIPYAVFNQEASNCGDVGRRNGNNSLNMILDATKKCLQRGVPVGLGNDAGIPFITHYNYWRELFYFKKYMKVSPEFTLYSATLGNAEILGINGVTGSVEVGKFADLIVCEKNPLDTFYNLQKLSYVFTRGNMIKDPKIKKMKQVDSELDCNM